MAKASRADRQRYWQAVIERQQAECGSITLKPHFQRLSRNVSTDMAILITCNYYAAVFYDGVHRLPSWTAST